MKRKDLLYLLGLSILLFFAPAFCIAFIACGFADFQRSRQFNLASWRRYFFGNGLLTWVLSPFNLLVDLLCKRNRGIYALADLPDGHQEEIRHVIDAFRKNLPYVQAHLAAQMPDKRRGMCFARWYGVPVESSIDLPEFGRDFKYVQTIGISVFNERQSTSVHYGPLRLTLRCLYNLQPVQDENVYINVAGHRHYWHDEPLFIFDDTLVHQSINDSDRLRYCIFLDILRPTHFGRVLHALVTGVRLSVVSVRRVFYANWEMIR
ncbi:aspartyl/asparaginyl beta-hydroxylase domain-containing protein [Caballeronia sp. LZ035]|uniref:aspartyl/asparaginyl beta-hydroxylase domain-containing protein n=1 Tax=Caballeronia sp. LZ035 TaxID=3038568 RepID=UPI002858843B|nr:aspartyl/asparaginyl beta-hydroxylase domain-containing protein [Caballeronia sp. LZ035]MDR5760220.1 aspartyl/asparaginyl beta-hydroxylase domain-containing protein [Caballeronia sp. LZ035]